MHHFPFLKALAIENSTFDMLESESATINIKVLDVNDNPPQFVINEYSQGFNHFRGTVEENAEVGTVIMSVRNTICHILPTLVCFPILLPLDKSYFFF